MDILFYNGDILTMENENSVNEAVLVSGGKIEQVGEYEKLLKLCKDSTVKYNLDGKCLMPSFIDAHSHICLLYTSRCV